LVAAGTVAANASTPDATATTTGTTFHFHPTMPGARVYID